MRLYERMLGRCARLSDRYCVWYRLPALLAIPVMIGHRVNMREQNLTDTEREPSALKPTGRAKHRSQREADGSCNDLGKPWMGMAGARFGRNVPLEETHGEAPPALYDPNPRRVSQELLARNEFVPVPHLNVLAAAWLQFMVHDWLSHGSNDHKAPPHEIDLPPGDDWPSGKMKILRTRPDGLRSTGDDDWPAAFRNTETHWWDGSQIYGSSLERQQLVRTDPRTGEVDPDGKLYLEDGHLPIDRGAKLHDLELSGVNGNWWIGLSLMHTLFAREHNTIVDRLHAEYPAADGEWLFQKARLANAALMAKIHTIDWTPALMNSPVGRFAMRGNWYGLLGERFARAFGRIGSGEILSGIPGSRTEHHAVPYAMTEEFTAAYRMHALLPDDYSFRHHGDDTEVLACNFSRVSGGGARHLYTREPRVSFDDAMYSLATSHAGALVLHNFPNALRRLPKKETADVLVDTAATDILRDRERGVPRYCAFRRAFGMRVPRSFPELTANVEWQRQLAAVYGSVEKVDLMVGMYCEASPPGFGFSDTAFRIFILMASRRLKSDRFFTTDFTPEVYTPAGFAWARDNDFRSVLERHCPALRGRFTGVTNLFFPWNSAVQ